MKFDRKAASGARATDAVDAVQEPLAVAPAAHAPQQRTRHVLQREVEVRHAGGEDRLHQPVGELGRVQVEQPHPGDAAGDRLDEGHDVLGADALVAPVAGQVLRDEHDLLGPAGHELVDLEEDLLDRPRSLGAAEARDGTEPARLVTALRDLDVGPRRLGRGTREVQQVEARERRGVGLAAEGDRHPEPGHRVDLGKGGGQLVAVALRHAAGHDDLGARRLALGQAEHDVDRLLPGLLDEGTRVDHHEIRRLGRRGTGHPVGEEGAHELVGVDLVLGAAKGLDEERAPARGHGARVPVRLGGVRTLAPAPRSRHRVRDHGERSLGGGPMVQVPATTADADASFVTSALRSTGVIGSATSVAEVEHVTIGEGVGIVGQLARLQLRYDGPATAAPGTVIMKIPSQYPENRAVADHFNFYEREGRFYQQLADKVPVRTPDCYWNEIDVASGAFGLLLEDLGDRTMISQIAGIPGARAAERAPSPGPHPRHVVGLTGPRRAGLDAAPRRAAQPRRRAAVPGRVAALRGAHRGRPPRRRARARRAGAADLRGPAPRRHGRGADHGLPR